DPDEPGDLGDLGDDLGARPTYGVMILRLGDTGASQLLDLNYGRRANRLWESQTVRPQALRPFDRRLQHRLMLTGWSDLAPLYGVDGDDIRHGRYPDWLKERAKTDPRFDRPDEKPFRSHGNTFDAAVG